MAENHAAALHAAHTLKAILDERDSLKEQLQQTIDRLSQAEKRASDAEEWQECYRKEASLRRSYYERAEKAEALIPAVYAFMQTWQASPQEGVAEEEYAAMKRLEAALAAVSTRPGVMPGVKASPEGPEQA